LSSSDEVNEDQDWHQGQNNRKSRSGRYWISSSRSYASSSTTLHDLSHSRGRNGGDDDCEEEEEDEDDEEELPGPFFNSGSNGLKLWRHRFKWLTPTVFILFSRLVLVPSICLLVIMFWPKSLSPMLTKDPTFSLVMVLIVASPTAVNLVQLSQVKDFFVRDMTGVLFWSYCVFGLPCVLLWSLVGLWAVGR
ncbi:hypothetical protein BGZ65_012678, partial [Modicella reniformis]